MDRMTVFRRLYVEYGRTTGRIYDPQWDNGSDDKWRYTVNRNGSVYKYLHAFDKYDEDEITSVQLKGNFAQCLAALCFPWPDQC